MSRKRKYPQMSEEEAREVLEHEVRDKDFWGVDADYDNSERLQNVLDVLFNSLEGNKYKVAYQENQNGTRLQIQCQICRKDLTSYDPFITHENGKSHKKIRQQKLTPQDPNIGQKLEFRKHNEPRGIFPPGSLEDQIDNTESLVLGVQYVFKEVIKGKDTYSCQLCNLISASTLRMFNHLTLNGHGSHNNKYLEVKYGFIKNSRQEAEQYGRIVEEREGKINTSIVDFTKQLPAEKTCEPVPVRTKSRSPSRHSSSPTLSEASRSPSPWERKAAMPQTPPLPPPPPPSVSAGVIADFSELPRSITKEVEVLKEVECKDTIVEDEDMQELCLQTLCVLNQKMMKHFQHFEANVCHRLVVPAMKVEEYIKRLDIV